MPNQKWRHSRWGQELGSKVKGRKYQFKILLWIMKAMARMGLLTSLLGRTWLRNKILRTVWMSTASASWTPFLRCLIKMMIYTNRKSTRVQYIIRKNCHNNYSALNKKKVYSTYNRMTRMIKLYIAQGIKNHS